MSILQSVVKHVNEVIRVKESELLGLKTRYRTLEAEKAAGKWIDSLVEFNHMPKQMRDLQVEIDEAEAFRTEILGRLK